MKWSGILSDSNRFHNSTRCHSLELDHSSLAVSGRRLLPFLPHLLLQLLVLEEIGLLDGLSTHGTLGSMMTAKQSNGDAQRLASCDYDKVRI